MVTKTPVASSDQRRCKIAQLSLIVPPRATEPSYANEPPLARPFDAGKINKNKLIAPTVLGSDFDMP
jgi:hypothetical protein